MCNTSWTFKFNCKGSEKNCKQCGDSYCAYHQEAVNNIATPVGGHVCPKQTAGQALTRPVETLKDMGKSLALHAGKWAINLNDKELIKLLVCCSHDCYVFDNKHLKTDMLKCIKMNKVIKCWYGIQEITGGKHKGKKVLAFKGTDNGHDVAKDVGSAVGFGNLIIDAQREGVKVAREWKVSFLTGHSLGGCIAQCVCAMTGIEGAVFQSMGPYTFTNNNLLEDNKYHNTKFEVHQVKSDPVSEFIGVGLSGPNSCQIAKPIWHSLNVKDPLDKHKITNMMNQIVNDY